MNSVSQSHIIPQWPAPAKVKAVSTTRLGGYSCGVYSSNNLATHVGDNAEAVIKNRHQLQLTAGLPSEPVWLTQVHSNRVVRAEMSQSLAEADAATTAQVQTVCVVMTADCLPVLFASKNGQQVAATHAGWRGLLDGILENTVAEFSQNNSEIIAWLGPAIGPQCFEVGEDVFSAFTERDEASAIAFRRVQQKQKWLADIYQLARLRLNSMGVTDIYGGDCCTYSDETHFFSYRRDGVCGRMATLIWLDK